MIPYHHNTASKNVHVIIKFRIGYWGTYFFYFAGGIFQESQRAGPKDMPTGHQY